MSLRKSPCLTPAFLAACRANAQKSTGPRTDRGKGHIVLNAMKHGRYSKSFRESLVRAGAEVETYDWIEDVLFRCFEPCAAHDRWETEKLAREIWCYFRRQSYKSQNRKSARSSKLEITLPGELAQFSAVSARAGRRLTFTLARTRPWKIRASVSLVLNEGAFPASVEASETSRPALAATD